MCWLGSRGTRQREERKQRDGNGYWRGGGEEKKYRKENSFTQFCFPPKNAAYLIYLPLFANHHSLINSFI